MLYKALFKFFLHAVQFLFDGGNNTVGTVFPRLVLTTELAMAVSAVKQVQTLVVVNGHL